MRLWRRYCVTVMDNWTPLQYFWTRARAVRFYRAHFICAHLYEWHRVYGWQEINVND